MITVESFSKIIRAIQSINAQSDALNKALAPFFDGHPVLIMHMEAVGEIVRELELAVRGGIAKTDNDGRDWYDIEWWLYEGGSKKVEYPGGLEVNINTPEKLYALIKGELPEKGR